MELLPNTFWPDLSLPTLAWFATIVILALTLRLKPLLSLRNLDALVLVFMTLLIVLRANTQMADSVHTWQWWSYLGLTITVGYWAARGLGLLVTGGMPKYDRNVSRGAMIVLLLAGLSIGVYQVSTAPVSSGARDGIVGGLCTLDTGKLPYGDAIGYDAQSPLLYLLYAGAEGIAPPTYEPADGGTLVMTWQNRERWLSEDWLQASDLTIARLVNALLFIGVLVGLYLIGRLLDSPAVGPTMMAIFCVFPGAFDGLSRPEIMLPTMLLTWTIAFALIPRVGGILSTLGLVFAGLAWPWAWLGLPVLLAYFGRKGWQSLGASLGLLGGAAAVGIGLVMLVAPTMPRADGALAVAGERAQYVAESSDNRIIFDQNSAEESADVPQAMSAVLWRTLLSTDSITMGNEQDLTIDWPNGVAQPGVLYRTVTAEGEAIAPLNESYRRAVAAKPEMLRAFVGLRTVLEATWFPAYERTAPVTSAWEYWSGQEVLTGRWLLVRRCVKGGAALVAILAAVAIFFGGRVRPRHMVAGLLAVASVAMLGSADGGVTNLVWLLPLILTLRALHETPESKVDLGSQMRFAPSDWVGVAGEGGPAPRISVDD